MSNVNINDTPKISQHQADQMMEMQKSPIQDIESSAMNNQQIK